MSFALFAQQLGKLELLLLLAPLKPLLYLNFCMWTFGALTILRLILVTLCFLLSWMIFCIALGFSCSNSRVRVFLCCNISFIILRHDSTFMSSLSVLTMLRNFVSVICYIFIFKRVYFISGVGHTHLSKMVWWCGRV